MKQTMSRNVRYSGWLCGPSVRFSLLIVLSCVMTLGRANTHCQLGISDVASRAIVSPLVLEATVTGLITHPNSMKQSAYDTDNKPGGHHQVTLQVEKWHRDLRISKDNAYATATGSRSGGGSNSRGSNSNNNNSKRSSRTANGQMMLDFWSKADLAVYPECTFNINLFQVNSKYIVFATELSPSKLFDKAPRYTLFSEPVRQNKTSSRHVRKVLCAACAKPPNVTSITDFKSKTFKEKSPINITCKTSGMPPPSVTWYKNGVQLNDSSRVQIKQKKYQSKVVIRSAKVQDSGEYECRAVSILSPAASKKTKVVVRERKVNTTTAPVTTSWPFPGSECPHSTFCLNGGKCIFYSNIAEQVCECTNGFSGQRCENKDVRVGEVKQAETMYLLAILIVVVILGVLFSVFALYIISRKEGCKKRKTKVKTGQSSSDDKENLSADAIAMLPQDGHPNNRTEIIPPHSNALMLLQRAEIKNESQPMIYAANSCSNSPTPTTIHPSCAHRNTPPHCGTISVSMEMTRM